MGKVMSLAVRASQRFNAESRAHRVLEQQKPKPAPKYEANIRELERTLEENPGLIENLNKRDSVLDNRLKQVYVTSQSEFIENKKPEDPDRPLPVNRTTPEEFEYGYMEVTKIPRGKVSMRNVIQFLSDHQNNPTEYTAAKISSDYKVKEEYISDILEHYKMLSLHITDPKKIRLPAKADLPRIEGKSINSVKDAFKSE